MLYHLHDWQRAWLGPWSGWAHDWARELTNPNRLWADDPVVREMAAELELFSRLGRDYPKPVFGITEVSGATGLWRVDEDIDDATPFCQLRHFRKHSVSGAPLSSAGPRLLIVAPLSGHHATLLRDTVRTALTDHDVWVTDWRDARLVPTADGAFSLDDYVRTVERFVRRVDAHRAHVLAVCQPTVPVLAAVSLMAARGEATPRSVTLMGGPVDPRCSPTQVNNLATRHPWEWFRTNLIHRVPSGHPGVGRLVYPGFLQHAGFMAMNPTRHWRAHWDFYRNLVRGDGDDAQAHRAFYDEYNAVLDMPAEYYLDTIRVVFQEFLLPQGRWRVGDEPVTPSAWRSGALLTLEGANDDISGPGQTRAAQDLCTGLPLARRHHREIPSVGHYGLFSGRRWREEIYPVLRDFVRAHDSARARS